MPCILDSFHVLHTVKSENASLNQTKLGKVHDFLVMNTVKTKNLLRMQAKCDVPLGSNLAPPIGFLKMLRHWAVSPQVPHGTEDALQLWAQSVCWMQHKGGMGCLMEKCLRT